VRIPVESHVYDIPRRLLEVTGDPDIRVYFNTETNKYEIMGVDASFTPYVITRFDALDARAERVIGEAYAVARRTGDPYGVVLRRIAEQEARREEKYWKDLTEKEYQSRDVLRYADTPVITPGLENVSYASVKYQG